MLKFVACTPLQASMLSDFQGSPKCAQKRQRHHADPHRTVQALRAHELTSLLRSLPFPHPRKLPVIFASVRPCPSRSFFFLGKQDRCGGGKGVVDRDEPTGSRFQVATLPSWYNPHQACMPYPQNQHFSTQSSYSSLAKEFKSNSGHIQYSYFQVTRITENPGTNQPHSESSQRELRSFPSQLFPSLPCS